MQKITIDGKKVTLYNKVTVSELKEVFETLNSIFGYIDDIVIEIEQENQTKYVPPVYPNIPISPLKNPNKIGDEPWKPKIWYTTSTKLPESIKCEENVQVKVTKTPNK